jgi:carbonic anhydrase
MKKNIHILLLFTFILGCNEHSIDSRDKAKKPLQRLIEGNERFIQGKFQHHRSPQLLEELSKGQHPYAVIVSCSDSRISPNVLFDTDLGDLFIIRTAGNIIGEVEIASVEYAIEHLHSPLIVVLGHSQCGAIEAFLGNETAHGHIKTLIDSLKAEPEQQDLLKAHDLNPNHYVQSNIVHQAKYLKTNSSIIQNQIQKGSLKIVEAYLDTKTGKVSFNPNQ